jgi:hypothetical protein
LNPGGDFTDFHNNVFATMLFIIGKFISLFKSGCSSPSFDPCGAEVPEMREGKG